jgi:hypothetical protein
MDWIALGGRADVFDQRELERAGIRAVLQLYGPEPDPLAFPFAEEVLSLFVIDGQPIEPSDLREGVEFIRTQRTAGRPVLVTCGAGMSRSPSFLAAYLHEEGTELGEAFARILRRRPRVLPHPELLRSLVDYYALPMSAEELLVRLVRLRKSLPQERAWL